MVKQLEANAVATVVAAKAAGAAADYSGDVAVLPFLGELEFEVLDLQGLFVFPMAVQSVDDTLRVCCSGIDDVAGLFLRVIAYLGESSFETGVRAVESGKHTVDDVFLSELVFVTHSEDRLLGVAAAVFERLYDVAIAHICGIDYAFGRETHLSGNCLYGGLYVAAALLQGVEVNVQGLCKLAQSETIALYSLFDAVGVLVVLQLRANGIELCLRFNALRGCCGGSHSIASETKTTISEQGKEHEVCKWIVHPAVHTGHSSVHHSGHSPRAVVVLTIGKNRSSERVVVVAVATIDFFYF